MSSTLTYPSQISKNVQTLLCLTTTTVWTPDNFDHITSVMTLDEFSNETSTSTVPQSTGLRDMGKPTVVVDDLGRHLAIYRLVQLEQGSETEGVPPSYTEQKYYVRTWSADFAASPVTVCRTG